MRVAFVGLGVMGYPMAGHLHKAGLAVTVYNRTPSRAQRWVAEFGGWIPFTKMCRRWEGVVGIPPACWRG